MPVIRNFTDKALCDFSQGFLVCAGFAGPFVEKPVMQGQQGLCGRIGCFSYFFEFLIICRLVFFALFFLDNFFYCIILTWIIH